MAMIAVASGCKTRKERREFLDSLDDDQLRVYENVKAARWTIFMKATVAGIIAGLVTVYMYLKTEGSTPYVAGCMFVGSAFLTQYFWYILSPKTDWMVTILKTPEQREEWRDVYREYQRTAHVAVIIGLAGYFAFGTGMCEFLGTC